MKKILLPVFLFVLICNRVNANDSSYVIEGRSNDVKSGTVHLIIYGDQEINDNAKINNGTFVFKGTIQQPSQAILTLKDKPEYFTFYVEPGNINISGEGKNLKELVVSNSQLNDDDKVLKQRMKEVTEWEENNSKMYEIASHEKNTKMLDSLDRADFE